MAVRKRGKKWFVDVYLPNSERMRRIVGTKKEADAVERQLLADIASGNAPVKPVEDLRFRDLVPHYLQHAKLNKSARTSRDEEWAINAHLVPFFGSM